MSKKGKIITELLEEFYPFLREKLELQEDPKVVLKNNSENAQDPLGRTAHYDPDAKTISVYMSDRHPKDILRSISHEMVHHAQNCRGDLDNVGDLGEGYAQSDGHMRKMELEAYQQGNIIFRDWTDERQNTKERDMKIKNNNIAMSGLGENRKRSRRK